MHPALKISSSCPHLVNSDVQFSQTCCKSSASRLTRSISLDFRPNSTMWVVSQISTAVLPNYLPLSGRSVATLNRTSSVFLNSGLKQLNGSVQQVSLDWPSIKQHLNIYACENGSAGETTSEKPLESQESMNQERGGDTLQASVTTGKVLGGDMMKLFNDAQQNMLYLNKQRLIAMDGLHKSERERELLIARVSQLEAEMQAGIAQRDLLEQKLQNLEEALEVAKVQPLTDKTFLSDYSPEIKPLEGTLASTPQDTLPSLASITPEIAGIQDSEATPVPVAPKLAVKSKADPPSLWSILLLRIDSMVLEKVITLTQAKALRELVVNRDARLVDTFEELEHKDDVDLVGSLIGLLDGSKRKGMYVVQICTEFFPLAKTGSLAAWISGLCRSLRRKGHLVEVVLPKYSSLDTSTMGDFREVKGHLPCYFGGETYQNKLWTGTVHGLPVTLIEPLHPAGYFSRTNIYGYEDDFERFSYFCRAALEWLQVMGKTPDVLHLHNWHTAITAPLFWDVFYHQGLQETRLLLTCHNFKYQSAVEPGKLALCGLDPSQLHRPDRLQDNQDPSKANILKGGIVYSNKVTTVSPRYASDVRNFSSGFGHGLEATLATHEHKFVGVPSGVDEVEWNPSSDSFLPFPFAVEDLSGKARAKLDLQQRLGLPLEDNGAAGQTKPLVGCVVPLISEKELDLIKAAMDRTISSGGQFVAVGGSKNPRVQAQLEEIRRELLDENTELIINYDDAMAHAVVAASDILICPDTANPVGSYPLIALKYGSLPIMSQQQVDVDSIVDVDERSRGSTDGNAFVFNSETPGDMEATLQRAIERMKSDPESWSLFIKNAMCVDHSWDSFGSEAYVEAYRSIHRC